MRICLVYDCLYPHTVGGAERWYRSLAARLADEGHTVTYLTLRQWPKGTEPDAPRGTAVVAAGPQMGLYGAGGGRRIAPPLVFGFGVLLHLLRHGRNYDVVHTASFPFFSLLASALLRPLAGYRLVVDWFEVWTLDYWQEYLGRLGGRVGWWVQRLCVRLGQHVFCFSDVHARRLRDEGVRVEPQKLEGIFAGPTTQPVPAPAEPFVMFAGRHIREKRVPLLVDAMAHVRELRPDLRCEIYGDGPDRDAVAGAVAGLRLEDRVTLHGFVGRDEVDRALTHATALVLPSRREGYGLVVVEASSKGTPSVVVSDPDNAATELVDDHVNGVVARTGTAAAMAEAIIAVHDAGHSMREDTARWFGQHADRLSLERSLAGVAASYATSR